MASRTKTYSSSFHYKGEDPYSHLFYAKKSSQDQNQKPPLHLKSVNEDFDKSQKSRKPSHKKNPSSCDFDEERNYEYLKQKTQMILNDLNKLKGTKTTRPKEGQNEKNSRGMESNTRQLEPKDKRLFEPQNTKLSEFQKNRQNELQNSRLSDPQKTRPIDTNKTRVNDQQYTRKSTIKREESDESSSLESKENRLIYSNMKKSGQKDLNRNKRDIEVLSNYHEKDMEIIELRNKISKYEIEAKSVDASLNKLFATIEKYKQEIGKLQQERGLKDKEIEYMKKYKSKLEDDVKNLKKELDMPRNSHWEQVVSEKNRELIELKEKLLINNAEHRILLTNEKDRLENELKAKDVVIKERNRMISDLEQYKAQNQPYFEGYQSLSIKIKELERTNATLSEENNSLRDKLETRNQERSQLEAFVKEFKIFFLQARLKITEIGDMGSQVFEISRQVLSGEEVNIDLLVGLVKPTNKNKKKQEMNNGTMDSVKGYFEDLGILKGLVGEVFEKFKRNINEMYEVYVKKCGENCNIQ